MPETALPVATADTSQRLLLTAQVAEGVELKRKCRTNTGRRWKLRCYRISAKT